MNTRYDEWLAENAPRTSSRSPGSIIVWFGKFKGYTLSQTYQRPRYIRWCLDPEQSHFYWVRPCPCRVIYHLLILPYCNAGVIQYDEFKESLNTYKKYLKTHRRPYKSRRPTDQIREIGERVEGRDDEYEFDGFVVADPEEYKMDGFVVPDDKSESKSEGGEQGDDSDGDEGNDDNGDEEDDDSEDGDDDGEDEDGGDGDEGGVDDDCDGEEGDFMEDDGPDFQVDSDDADAFTDEDVDVGTSEIPTKGSKVILMDDNTVRPLPFELIHYYTHTSYLI